MEERQSVEANPDDEDYKSITFDKSMESNEEDKVEW